jgi:hypothetical protein
MNHRAFRPIAALLAAALLDGTLALAAGADRQGENKKPSLSLKLTPPIAFSPAKIRVSVEVRGGADDYVDYYCPTVEWDWGDGTISENSSDCDPYERGKSTIRRRYTADHIYRQQGQFKVVFKLKQKTKQVAAVSTNVQVRGGVGDGFGR